MGEDRPIWDEKIEPPTPEELAAFEIPEDVKAGFRTGKATLGGPLTDEDLMRIAQAMKDSETTKG